MNKVYRFATLLLFLCVYQSNLLGTEKSIDLNIDSKVASQIDNLSDHIDMRYNAEIKSIIRSYTQQGRHGMTNIIARSKYYFPLIEQSLIQQGVPEELKFLSVVESSLNPVVRSKAGAVGLWQFMESTARMYGLYVGNTYDERKNVKKSTDAAILYLKDLHGQFGDWGLAIAAYNCGPGNLRKAIRKANSRDYWDIRKYLPKETRRYLPKFIALSYILTYSDELGLEHEDHRYTEHTAFSYVRLLEKSSFKEIQKLTGLTIQEIKKYNTAYFGNTIYATKTGAILILPEKYMFDFLSRCGKSYEYMGTFYLENHIFPIPVEIVKDHTEELPKEEKQKPPRVFLREDTIESPSIIKLNVHSKNFDQNRVLEIEYDYTDTFRQQFSSIADIKYAMKARRK